MLDAIVKRFDKPDEIRQFPKGRFELVTIAELRKDIERVASETEREKAERLHDHSALQRRLEQTAVGELAVERVGLCWLIVGLLMTTVA